MSKHRHLFARTYLALVANAVYQIQTTINVAKDEAKSGINSAELRLNEIEETTHLLKRIVDTLEETNNG